MIKTDTTKPGASSHNAEVYTSIHETLGLLSKELESLNQDQVRPAEWWDGIVFFAACADNGFIEGVPKGLTHRVTIAGNSDTIVKALADRMELSPEFYDMIWKALTSVEQRRAERLGGAAHRFLAGLMEDALLMREQPKESAWQKRLREMREAEEKRKGQNGGK